MCISLFRFSITQMEIRPSYKMSLVCPYPEPSPFFPMAEFRNPVPLPAIPDDLTIPQFMLREITGRPTRPSNVPYFIHDATGRAINYEEVSAGQSVGVLSGTQQHRNVGPPPDLLVGECTQFEVEYQ